MIGSLERVSPTEVIVEWSQPPGGATMTGYVVFYYDGSVNRNKSHPLVLRSQLALLQPFMSSQ